MRKAGALAIGLLLVTAMTAAAAAFSTVRGVVHDTQHRPIPGATVTIKARSSEWSSETTTGADGTFEFRPVAIGDYLVTVTIQGFVPAEQPVTVVSSTTPVLHIELEVAGVTQSVTVTRHAGERPSGFHDADDAREPRGDP